MWYIFIFIDIYCIIVGVVLYTELGKGLDNPNPINAPPM